MSDKVNVGNNVSSFDIAPQFNVYSGVEIVVDENTSFFAGNKTGRVLTIENPWGTQEQAETILDALSNSGFQYQPFTASGAQLNPAAELGDGITIAGTYSGIYKLSRSFGPLMYASVEAPQDEEIDHEYPYESKQDRIYKREIADTRSQIGITATEIYAQVLSKSGGSSSSFGWNLTDSSWELQSNGETVFRATSDGVEVRGRITATSGYIGNGANGFTITGSSIYNGMSSINSSSDGIYIGTNGISVGGGNFKVTSEGKVSAKDMNLSGTLNIGGTDIKASQLRSGAQSAYDNSGTWSGTSTAWGNATKSSGASGPKNFACTSLKTDNLTVVNQMASLDVKSPGFCVGGLNVYWVWIKDQGGISRHVLASANNGTS